MNTFDHQQQQLSLVRFGDQSHVFTKKTQIDLYCHRHPDKLIHQGCVAQNCQKMLMCTSCNFDDNIHFQEHKEQIVDLATFLEILASEIKKVNRKDSMLYNNNVKQVLENEHNLLLDYDQLCKKQTKLFNQLIDEQVGLIIHHFQIVRQQVSIFFEKQFNSFSGNIHYFKTQYQQMNPEETLAHYGDVPLIISKLYAKTPTQCFQFLNNLRKSANMEGQLLSDLDYISSLVLKTTKDNTYLLQEYALDEIKIQVQSMIESTRTIINDSLKYVPQINKEIHSSIISQAFISYNRHKIRLNQTYLFDNTRFEFKNVSQIQTHHTNSVTALVALSDDVVITSSYDRSIRIWNLSTGALIKSIFDSCCISCLTVLKIKNDKNPQVDSYTDDDTLKLHTSIQSGKISDSGFLLISGGFDKSIKVWDFDLKPSQTTLTQLESSKLSQPYQMSSFPITILKGHNSWITALISLDDEKNVVAADDSGEAIVWDVISSTLLYRLTHIRNPGIIPFISLTVPLNQFCCASATILRIYQTYYKSVDEINTNNPKFKERLANKFASKSDPLQISPQLTNVILQRELDIGWGIYGCICPTNYPNILIVFGAQPNKIKYILLNQNKQIEIKTDFSSYIGHLILIEKHRLLDGQIDQFYKNFNFIVCGDKQIALLDGYGNKIRSLESQVDDFYSSNILCQRNLQILKLEKKGVKRILRMSSVSQYGTDDYKYKSSRITIFEIHYENN